MWCFTECRTEKFKQKLLGEDDIGAVLQRLDRLTIDEARATEGQLLEVVLGLGQHTRIDLDGKKHVPTILLHVDG